MLAKEILSISSQNHIIVSDNNSVVNVAYRYTAVVDMVYNKSSVSVHSYIAIAIG